ncbi:MAG: hypothetical protein ABII00_14405 [Elusimicrobiota bacterium]
MGQYAELMPLAIFAGAAAFAGAVFLWFRYRGKQRREALSRLAKETGLDFLPEDPSLISEGIGRLQLFNLGHSKRSRNVMRGKAHGTDTLLFDYSYTTGGGKNRSTHRATVAAFHNDKRELPHFEMRPERFFHKIGSAFGYQDIDFESNSGFSKSYLLRGPDAQAVRGLYGPSVLQHFEIYPGWCVEGGGGWLACYRADRRVEPGDMWTFLDEARVLLSVFPQ